MRNYILTMLFCFILFSAALPQDNFEFKEVRYSFNGSEIWGYKFFDDLNGYLLHTGGVILKTSDGGETFEQVKVAPGKTLIRMSFLNKRIGYCVDNDWNIYRTENYCKTWEKVSRMDYYPKQLHPLTEDILWIRTDYRIFKSVNKGKDIQESLYAGSDAYYDPKFTSSFFLDENYGWIAGDKQITYKTTDGGLNWEKQQPDNGVNHSYNYIYFMNKDTGWVTDQVSSHIYSNSSPFITTDGGNTWSPFAADLSYSNEFLSVVFTDKNTGWMLRDSISKTTDFGKTWVHRDLPFRAFPVWVQDSTFCIRNDKKIMMTTNGGTSWQDKVIFETSRYTTVSFSDNIIMAATDDGHILISTDNINWKKSKIDDNRYYDSEIYNDVIWLAANNGTISRKNITDEEWSNYKFGYPFEFRTLDVIDDQNIIVAGAGKNSIKKSTDGGVSWNDCLIDKNLIFSKIEFVDQNNGFIIGYESIDARSFNTYLYNTSDGGYNWNLRKTFVDELYISMDFTGEHNGWIGESYTGWDLLHTTDGGLNWEKAEPGNTGELLTISFTDSENGIAAGTNGNLVKTSDGGANWIKENSFFRHKFIDTYVSDNNFVALTESGTIFSTNFNISGINDTDGGLTTIPENCSLSQNYPNPFNPSTNIRFSVKEAGQYKLSVYNMLGEEVKTIVNEQLPAGEYTEKFDASGLTSGVYIYRLTGKNVNLANKMILLR